MDDPTLPRVPVVLDVAQPEGVKVAPRCSMCGTEVPDLTDPKHHVCVPDPAGAVETPEGKFTKSTLDESTKAWEKTEAEFRAAEDAAAADAAKDPLVP
ncbi:MAG TPA: hypothetical protein VGS01_09505 [Candidatus Limnocylindria bacterium]|nr:hypothetical protein [Candidatus Limnocylindria bacterium]